jgi:hypothetical protein
LISAFAPDGVHDLRITFKDGTSQGLQLDNNSVVLRTPNAPGQLIWSAPDETKHQQDVSLAEGHPPVTG